MEGEVEPSCDLLKIHYLCGDKDNLSRYFANA